MFSRTADTEIASSKSNIRVALRDGPNIHACGYIRYTDIDYKGRFWIRRGRHGAPTRCWRHRRACELMKQAQETCISARRTLRYSSTPTATFPPIRLSVIQPTFTLYISCHSSCAIHAPLAASNSILLKRPPQPHTSSRTTF